MQIMWQKSHLVTEYMMLVQKEYQRRHDNIARWVHRKLCGKYNMGKIAPWFGHKAEAMTEMNGLISCGTSIYNATM